MVDMGTHETHIREAERLERIRNMQRLVDEARACGDSVRTSGEMKESVRQRIAAIQAVE